MAKNHNKVPVITGIDLYLTRSGRIAFLQAERQRDTGHTTFFGYVYDRGGSRRSVRQLEWLPSGECINSSDDGDHIVRMA